MSVDLVTMMTNVIQALNNHNETDFGSVTSSDFRVVLNEFNEEAGIGCKFQFLLAGPTLNKIKEDGHVLYPDKTDEDMFGYLSIKVTQDPSEFIDMVKGLIEGFGIPLETMAAQFGDLKWHAGDGEVLIGFKAHEHVTGMAAPFLIKSGVFGDGSIDIDLEQSFNLGTTWDEMLDDEPIFTHILKGISFHGKATLHEKTRENVLKIIGEQNEGASSMLESPLPFIMPLLFFKRVTGSVELQCTDEMKEQIKTFAATHVPPSAMSLKDAFEMVKGMGVPLELLSPILEIIQNAGINEISFNGAGNLGVKFIIRLPGLNKAIEQFLSG